MLNFSQSATRWLIALVVLAGSVAAYAHSYHGLVMWASRHGQSGIWALTWPLMVDVFPVIGELALFEGALAGARLRSRLWAWCLVFTGLAISLPGNVYSQAVADWPTRLTDAVPPLAAATALGVGLGILKRVVAEKRGDPAPSFHRPRWLRRPSWLPRKVVDVQLPATDTKPVAVIPAPTPVKPARRPVKQPAATQPRTGGPGRKPMDLAPFQPVIDAIAASLAEGQPVTPRKVAERYTKPGREVTRYTADKLIAAARASSNGHQAAT